MCLMHESVVCPVRVPDGRCFVDLRSSDEQVSFFVSSRRCSLEKIEVLRVGIEGEERKRVWSGSLVKGKIERAGLVRKTGETGFRRCRKQGGLGVAIKA